MSTFDQEFAALEKKIKAKNQNFFWLGVIFFLVFVLWLLIPHVVESSSSIEAGLPTAGEIGDSFGSVNALFAGLAFGGLIWTMYQTNYELKLQKQVVLLQIKELRESTQSMKSQADAQDNMTDALLKLAKATESQAQIDSAIAILGNDKLSRIFRARVKENKPVNPENTVASLADSLVLHASKLFDPAIDPNGGQESND